SCSSRHHWVRAWHSTCGGCTPSATRAPCANSACNSRSKSRPTPGGRTATASSPPPHPASGGRCGGALTDGVSTRSIGGTVSPHRSRSRSRLAGGRGWTGRAPSTAVTVASTAAACADGTTADGCTPTSGTGTAPRTGTTSAAAAPTAATPNSAAKDRGSHSHDVGTRYRRMGADRCLGGHPHRRLAHLRGRMPHPRAADTCHRLRRLRRRPRRHLHRLGGGGMTPYYADDLVTLYHGDCREITAWLNADVLVTDPPYGQKWTPNTSQNGGQPGSAPNGGIIGDEDTTARD